MTYRGEKRKIIRQKPTVGCVLSPSSKNVGKSNWILKRMGPQNIGSVNHIAYIWNHWPVISSVLFMWVSIAFGVGKIISTFVSTLDYFYLWYAYCLSGSNKVSTTSAITIIFPQGIFWRLYYTWLVTEFVTYISFRLYKNDIWRPLTLNSNTKMAQKAKRNRKRTCAQFLDHWSFIVSVFKKYRKRIKTVNLIC